jgi:hypothetical protein
VIVTTLIASIDSSQPGNPFTGNTYQTNVGNGNYDILMRAI